MGMKEDNEVTTKTRILSLELLQAFENSTNQESSQKEEAPKFQAFTGQYSLNR
ncbi:hypothetical protein PIB30_069086 [Stylosanthes scabra]|uniref:Uncharacterized protein n=1 Tax=Stylosanthes scabra TaxID=79078 RepID=A0ABU6YKM6_9FABA|nr:hypothetical protein [Stylosanthes scabra]